MGCHVSGAIHTWIKRREMRNCPQSSGEDEEGGGDTHPVDHFVSSHVMEKMFPQSMSPWHVRYFRLKATEKSAETKKSLWPSPTAHTSWSSPQKLKLLGSTSPEKVSTLGRSLSGLPPSSSDRNPALYQRERMATQRGQEESEKQAWLCPPVRNC